MNIYKIAQGFGIPDGMVEVEITIKENGEVMVKIPDGGHGAGTSCGEHDKFLISKISQALGIEVEDAGLTSEGFKKFIPKQKAPPIAEQEEDPRKNKFDKLRAKPQKTLDLGFGH